MPERKEFNNFHERVREEARFMISTKCTLREVTEWCGTPKSTVHIDLTVRLEREDKDMARQVREILDFNKEDRTRRGGVATHSGWKRDASAMAEKAARHKKVHPIVPVAEPPESPTLSE